MTLLRRIWWRLRSFVGRDRLDRDFNDELATHLELLTDEARRRGLSDEEARREAFRKLGRPESLRDQHRDARGLPFVDALVQDSKYGIRMMWKRPAFTAVVTLTLALGIGANTALFSLVDSLLLRSLPVRDPDQLVQVSVIPIIPGGFRKGMIAFDGTVFEAVRAHGRTIADAVGFWRLDRPTVAVDGETELSRNVDQTSVNFWSGLGVSPVIGRTPDPADNAVAVISSRWWRARFDGRKDVLGRTLTVNGQGYTIIGVAPSGFDGFLIEDAADLWISTPVGGPELRLIARLKPGVTVVQAQGALHAYFRQYALDRFRGDFPPDQPIETELLPAGKGLSHLRVQYAGALLALMALVTIVLFTTCTNVGNLLMLRNAARRRELTVRAALGAGRSRLILQYLVESTLLAVVGCAIGLASAAWGVSVILSMLPLPAIPDSLAFHADARILGFAAGVSILSALLFGLAPAWRATDVDLAGSLRSSQGATPPKRARRLGRVLVACQVGFSVLLLVGAGLFVQTLRNLSQLDIGFSTDRLLQVSIDTRFAGYGRRSQGGDAENEDREGEVGGVLRLLRERVGAVAGVRAVTASRNWLMRGENSRMSVQIPGFDPGRDAVWSAVTVGPDFFEAMGIPVVRGRAFTAADLTRRGRYVINEAFVRHYFPNEDPLVRAPAIVGIVRDVRVFGPRSQVAPLMYELLPLEPDRVNALHVRTAGDPATLVPAIRDAVRSVHPKLFVGIRTMREEIEQAIARERMVAAISAFFSLLGLLLASIGIFGVASYAVAQRTKELAIRRALGAGQWSVIRESLRETSVVFGLGLAAGTIAAVVLVRLTASVIADLLFGLTATDATNIAGAMGVMVAVALAACLLPAHRATRIDPLAGIREE